MNTKHRAWRAPRWGLVALTALVLWLPAAQAAAPDKRQVLKTYADIAQAGYEDSLATAQALLAAVNALIAQPTEKHHEAAKAAWREARVPYMQTEVYRFGNPLVDAWEGRVNAWPLDEGLIDYVDGSYGGDSPDNPFYTANVIANASLRAGGDTVDARTINATLLAETLHEAGGIEANVATGYHAIEFLLWGQDLNGTRPGAGRRPVTDFDTTRCTGGHCERRAQYLRVASELLVADLKEMADLWRPGGEARERLLRGNPDEGLAAIITGMGSLSYGELAGERMKLGVMLHDPEEEHDCFSDNTHWSHYYDQVGIMNVYRGKYTRTDGRTVSGPGLGALVRASDPKLDAAIRAAMDAALRKLQAIVDSAKAGKAYDQLLDVADAAGNRLVLDAVDALVAQAKAVERSVTALKLSPIAFEGSDSLDNPGAVFK